VCACKGPSRIKKMALKFLKEEIIFYKIVY